MKFKIVAFAGLNSIQPVIFKYESSDADVEGCIIPVYANMMLMGANTSLSLKIIELPIFKPNEYFFKNHQKEGEDKAETYARVIREIMSKAGDLEMTDATAEDKYVYKSLVYNTKVSRD